MSKEWELLKEKGNEEFKKKNYNSAINLYSQAIGNKLINYYSYFQRNVFIKIF